MNHDVLTGASYDLVFNPLKIMTPAVETFIDVLTSNKKRLLFPSQKKEGVIIKLIL
ncbi:hypothetical protein ABFY09_00885 [Marinomonas sp. 5E14-1]|uniref:hypothetical protein n=1 Tax=Marinomonas sp. 5E14-1 TaxID=3153922 RepID=UPI0032666BE8